ncbi:MAG TPA: pyridoxamine 5'-phosphate oxidase family protein [Candidatus Limnocylindrales bacterium]|nr:pyridoxamine 5'-phosphate oxidase family protein [Candidatus Limnocylindrales bacterium]
MTRGAQLSERAREFLSAPRFATIATVDADGGPHQAVIWYLLADDHLVVNSMDGRRWPGNLRRDGRFSLVVENGLDYVSLAGTAREDTSAAQAQADIAQMARRHHRPEDAERMIATRFRKQPRVSFHLHPSRVHEHWEG